MDVEFSLQKDNRAKYHLIFAYNSTQLRVIDIKSNKDLPLSFRTDYDTKSYLYFWSSCPNTETDYGGLSREMRIFAQ